MAKEISVLLKGKKLLIDDEGLTPIEINSIIGKIEQEMQYYEDKKGVVDTIKQLMHVCIKYSVELHKKDKIQAERNSSYEEKMEKFIDRISSSLNDEKLL